MRQYAYRSDSAAVFLNVPVQQFVTAHNNFDYLKFPVHHFVTRDNKVAMTIFGMSRTAVYVMEDENNAG